MTEHEPHSLEDKIKRSILAFAEAILKEPESLNEKKEVLRTQLDDLGNHEEVINYTEDSIINFLKNGIGEEKSKIYGHVLEVLQSMRLAAKFQNEPQPQPQPNSKKSEHGFRPETAFAVGVTLDQILRLIGKLSREGGKNLLKQFVQGVERFHQRHVVNKRTSRATRPTSSPQSAPTPTVETTPDDQPTATPEPEPEPESEQPPIDEDPLDWLD